MGDTDIHWRRFDYEAPRNGIYIGIKQTNGWVSWEEQYF